jgi:bisphosphoglycerate-dependent phosphoglycerate mutase
MSDALPGVYLARHGETAWSISRQHTGLTDLPLTAQGEAEAARLGERLVGLAFAGVLTSPLQRAVRTSELAGFGSAAEVDPDLLEWNYGSYFLLGTASLSALEYENDSSEPVIRLWNETPHRARISPAQVRGHREKARR